MHELSREGRVCCACVVYLSVPGVEGIHHARMRKIRTKATGRALHQASPAGKGIASQRRGVAQRPGNGTTKGIGNELNFVVS